MARRQKEDEGQPSPEMIWRHRLEDWLKASNDLANTLPAERPAALAEIARLYELFTRTPT